MFAPVTLGNLGRPAEHAPPPGPGLKPWKPKGFVYYNNQKWYKAKPFSQNVIFWPDERAQSLRQEAQSSQGAGSPRPAAGELPGASHLTAECGILSAFLLLASLQPSFLHSPWLPTRGTHAQAVLTMCQLSTLCALIKPSTKPEF